MSGIYPIIALINHDRILIVECKDAHLCAGAEEKKALENCGRRKAMGAVFLLCQQIGNRCEPGKDQISAHGRSIRGKIKETAKKFTVSINARLID